MFHNEYKTILVNHFLMSDIIDTSVLYGTL